MIPTGAFIGIVDNTGALKVQVIGFLKKFRKRYGEITDIFILVIKKMKKGTSERKKLKEGGISYGRLVKTKKNIKRFGGTYIKGEEHGMVLVNKEFDLIAKRINSYVLFSFRENSSSRILTMAYNLL